MKFRINNVGPIDNAEIEFGKLTVLCGENNTGKTYITYNCYNYIDAAKYFLSVSVPKIYSRDLLHNGTASISLPPYLEKLNESIALSMERWSKEQTHVQMAAHEDLYRDTHISFSIDTERVQKIYQKYQLTVTGQITKECVVKASRTLQEESISFLLENTASKLPKEEVIQSFQETCIAKYLQLCIPDIFIITCERTGAAAFRPNFIVSKIVVQKKKTDAIDFDESYRKMDFLGYPRPMRKDIEFVTQLENHIQKKSYIADKHPEILSYFEEIAGGKYSIQEPNIIKFTPRESSVGLSPIEGSSSIRSLMELSFYLKHIAQKYQLIIIDEPELNLHPKNQRKLARLLAMLVNAGISVFLTTHSDYIVREFDFMTRLKSDPELAKKLGYTADQLLKADDQRYYVTKRIPDSPRYTVEQIPVTQDFGIDRTSFDDSIDEMNRIQQAIQLGDYFEEEGGTES